MQSQSNPQSNMQQNQSAMPQPPNVITTKDHSYLEDMLHWNMGAIKKANLFAGQCQDPEIQNMMMQVCQMHARHYNLLLNHLQNANQNLPNM
ncbi:MAG TPA: hypothetical protein VFK33_12630 [Bacillales bacterium]|nr:hypothetical protein [Bacillales bacterium]